MFLFILEDGNMKLYASVKDEDLEMCDDGYCDIIDVSIANNPKRYFNGEWTEIAIG